MQFSSIFQPCEYKSTSLPSKRVNIFNPTTFRTHQAQLYIYGRDLLYLKLTEKLNQLYQLSCRTKMQPIFKLENSVSVSLNEIKLHKDNQYLTIRSQNSKDLQQIYNFLRKLIAHKGFSDYFKPIRRLGKGAFATVYLVQNKFTKSQFAVKVFSREGQKIQFKGKEALENQIRMLRFLSHPNIIKYQGLYQTQNLIYLVTQYISGGTLSEFMKDRCKLTEQVISHFLSNSFNALVYLENNHIVHRDIKPQNIVLRPEDNSWVIIDFGLSAFSNQNSIYSQCGTIGYMAPQIMENNGLQTQQNKAFKSLCDIYSLGIITYELIMGNLPFKVQTEGLFQKKLVWNGLKSQNQDYLLLPQQMKSFLKGLLESNPKIRLTAQKALKSPIFTDHDVFQRWHAFGKKKRDQRYAKILQMANIN